MLKKVLDLLKANPVIVIGYIIFAMISSVPLAIISSSFNFKKLSDVVIASLYMILWLMLMLIISIIFVPCFLNMLKEASVSGKADFSSMSRGFKYIGKFFVAGLFLLVLSIPLMFIMLIILAPVFAILSSASPDNMDRAIMLSQTVFSFALVFVLPFFMLWIPALFFESYGVVDCLKHALKKVRGNYWELVLGATALMAPSYILTVCELITGDQYFASSYTSPSFWLMIIINIIVSLFTFAYLFLLYAEIKKREA